MAKNYTNTGFNFDFNISQLYEYTYKLLILFINKHLNSVFFRNNAENFELKLFLKVVRS